MPPLKNGTHINVDFARANGNYQRIRISAGKHRGEYVDKLILEAKLGRPLAPGMTVEHMNGDTFDFGVCGSNLIEVPHAENVKLMWKRRRQKREQIAAARAAANPSA